MTVDDAFREQRQAIREARRAFASSPDAGFARAMREAMAEYQQARMNGVSQADAIRGIEAVLRDVWPRKVSKFAPACSVCEDTGWELRTCCHGMRCQRRSCQEAHPAEEHAYAVWCACPAGDKFRVRRADEDAVAAAGRMPKKRGWTKL